MDTIFAQASARGKAGVAVIRISGPLAHQAVGSFCDGKLPEIRHASLRRLSHSGVYLDDALVILFSAGASFTGEASAELQVHGGTATVRSVISALGDIPGLRMAEPGEFTRRALENGCMDLTQVEGLADLIDAETEAQRRQAAVVMTGALAHRADVWRHDLIQAAALLEATIDFSDEDVPQSVLPEVGRLIAGVDALIDRELAGASAAERVRDGFEVAIVGAPNVGKSTLLNALAGREAAITSEIAGTTRDVIEVRMEISGLAVTLLDTAGIRETDDQVEKLGVGRALARARSADLRLFLRLEDEALPFEPFEGDLVVVAKADLKASEGLAVSGITGAGLDFLTQRIGEVLSQRVAGASLVIRERHKRALEKTRSHLSIASEGAERGAAVELIAEDLRSAVLSLETMIGRVGVEDLLGEIFSRFCIGK